MRTAIANEFRTLDGVVQTAGAADEMRPPSGQRPTRDRSLASAASTV
jgi:hypothetical protein